MFALLFSRVSSTNFSVATVVSCWQMRRFVEYNRFFGGFYLHGQQLSLNTQSGVRRGWFACAFWASPLCHFFPRLAVRKKWAPLPPEATVCHYTRLKTGFAWKGGYAAIEATVWKDALFPTMEFVPNLGLSVKRYNTVSFFLFSCAKRLKKGGRGSNMNAVFTAWLYGPTDNKWEYNHQYYQTNQLNFAVSLSNYCIQDICLYYKLWNGRIPSASFCVIPVTSAHSAILLSEICTFVRIK